ncbi:MAG: Rossmann-like fold-containing protein [Bacillota bacterium]
MLREHETLELLEQATLAMQFDPADAAQVRHALRHLKRGGTVILQGPREAILDFHRLVEKRIDELVQSPSGRHPSARDWAKSRRELLSRVLAEPHSHALVAGAPTDVDENPGALLPVATSLRTERALQEEYYLEALGASVLAHPEVLAPRSQPTINLIRAAIEATLPILPSDPQVLDMGCGSGCCGFVAAHVLAGKAPRITATDHSPYAIATTKLNAQRLVEQQMMAPGVVGITAGGDLFDPVADQHFDLIIFNAPWVVAPAKTLAETAINDGSQETIRRFLAEAKGHLRPGGRVIVGYADHSGPKALARLERFIADAGLIIEQVLSDRIQTHRNQRKWERIFAYILRRGK